jgi:TrmH family RNA methyltransferase
VKRLRHLAAKRRERRESGLCVLESLDLVTTALAQGVVLESLYVDESRQDDASVRAVLDDARARDIEVITLAEGVLEKATDAVTPQAVVAIARWTPGAVAAVPTKGFLLVLHDLRDPGNVGTLIRSAEAAGASAVVLTGDSVDVTNPKTLRATAGAAFLVPVFAGERDEAFDVLRRGGVALLATLARGGVDPAAADLTANVAVVLGTESAGLDDETLAACDGALTITMAGRSESLNVAVAGALVAFESLRQRRNTNQSTPPSSL